MSADALLLLISHFLLIFDLDCVFAARYVSMFSSFIFFSSFVIQHKTVLHVQCVFITKITDIIQERIKDHCLTQKKE